MLLTMYRTICLSLICVSVSLHYAAGAERPIKEAYESLATMQGNDYVTARDGFLAREDAKGFLESRIRQTPDDWFAFALWQRIANREFAELYDRLSASPPIKDRFAGRDFGPALFDPDPLPYGGRGARRFPRVYQFDIEDEDVAKRFDWMEEFALEMEWILRDPHDYSVCAQFSLLYAFCWGGWQVVPITKDDLQCSNWLFVERGGPVSKKSFKTLDPDRMKSWLAYARDHERKPIVRLLAASRVPGKKSAAVLEELSKEDSLVGMLAAFFYAGRDRRLLWYSGGHPFNGPWLEQWARRATPNQVRAAQWTFAHSFFNFPVLAVGPLIEHHPTLVGAEMKRRYHQSVEGGLETFKDALEGYKAREDVGGFTMKQARQKASRSMLWPKSAAADLKKINTTDRNARALIAKALSQLGQRTYPTGEDLQAIYGAKEK